MCGIAAVFNYKEAPAIDRADIEKVRDTMRSRGPDGSGLWISSDGSVGLAHRRLSIIDPTDRGAQPMTTPDGRFWITYNGEIYNFKELRNRLEKRGVAFKTYSDTEVLLELYRADGPDFVRGLRGMFAFALWDQYDQRLLLARDPFGIKPLYFADDGRTIRVASQVKALMMGRGISTAPSAAAHVGFFLWGYIPEPYTTYAAVRSLSPGNAMLISQGGATRRWAYADPIDLLIHNRPTNSYLSAKTEMVAILQRAVEESVRYHMVADVPVGCFLSSGIDSNVLCGLAANAVSDNAQLKCVTLGFSEYAMTHDDEVPLAREAAQRLNVKHHLKVVSKGEFQRELYTLLGSMDQPSIDGVNTYFVAKAAAETGLKVALSGLGADELFGGYPSFSQVPLLVSIAEKLHLSKDAGRLLRRVIAPIVGRITSPKYASILEYSGSIVDAFFLRRALFMPWELGGLLDPTTITEGCGELEGQTGLAARIGAIANPYARVMALEISQFLQPCLLRDADWAGMAHSLEIRTPYVDIDLFRAIVGLVQTSDTPPSKRDLASVSPIPLPEGIASRRKTGFSVPVRQWLSIINGTPNQKRGLRNWSTVVSRHFNFAPVSGS
jgi:asparagine synthase (glutamine-hydrolysing)